MFRESYERDNTRISPSEAVSDHVLDTILQEEAMQIPSIAPRRRNTRRIWQQVLAVAACAAIVCGAGWTALRSQAPAGTQPPANTPLPVVEVSPTSAAISYGEMFQTIRSIESLTVSEPDYAYGNSPSFNAASEDKAIDSATSRTNTQYANVDEADIVKTDGRYLYVLNSEKQRVSILQADGADTAVVSTIALNNLPIPASIRDTEYDPYVLIQNLYYAIDRLVVLYSLNDYSRFGCVEFAPGYAPSPFTYAAIYDVSDRTTPRLLSALGQDGGLVDSRLIDDVLYLVTSHWVGAEINEDDPATFVPSLYENENGTPVAETDLAVITTPDECSYSVVTAVSLNGEATRLSQKAVFGSGSGIVYANNDHLLLTESHYDCTDDGNFQSSTSLSLFSLTDGQIISLADGLIDGTLDSQFAIDEYDGYFRIAAIRASDNALYVLDSTLQVVGHIDDLAPGEQIKSVRFDETIGYVVTYKQVDPLFAIDLTDPTAPQVLSALKITGFSEYLHPFADDRLFGFGYAGNESGNTTGLKLIMFDTSDKGSVTVRHTLSLSSNYYYSRALYDHHAILVDADRSLIGFSADSANGSTYLLYSYDEENGFVQAATLSTSLYDNWRGIWVNDTFYLCNTDSVSVYTANNYTQIANISL